MDANDPVDLIMMPEMALIGYRFDNRDDIELYCETVPSDIASLINTLDDEEEKEAQPCTFKFALKVSRKFSPAWVAVGFAEKDSDGRFFNSAYVVNH